MIGRRSTVIDEGVGELEEQLADFFAAHYDRLVRLDGLVCHSAASVEDAVQAAMEKHGAAAAACTTRRGCAPGWTRSWYANRSG